MTNQQPKTKNDIAWERLFDQLQIPDQVQRFGQFLISAAQINQERESRLMAKFDQGANLPHIFRKHKLSILPVSRSHYVIGPFRTHQIVRYSGGIDVQSMPLPSNLESIDYSHLFSEAAALNCAYLAGMIDDLVGEGTYHTVSGRMSTDAFDFTISSAESGKSSTRIMVDGSQCEIDAGFEGERHFVLVEAKNFKVNDFLIRQLYYPYRLWARKLSKKVVPVLMTFSNDIFDFFMYEVSDINDYNSFHLMQHKRYSVAPEDITREDVSTLVERLHRVPEPMGIPFPQANNFNRVVDLLVILAERGPLSADDIMANYAFNVRQAYYYTDAARYLGLVEKFTDPASKEAMFRLTNEASVLMNERHKLRYVALIRKILQHEVFHRAFLASLEQGGVPSASVISDIMGESNIALNETTSGRRASTVRRWTTWIWEQIAD